VPSPYKSLDDNNGKPWGVEHLSMTERYLRMIMVGVDQVGGILTKQYIEEAYALGVKLYGKAIMRQRYEASARRMLQNMFRLGLFENPYLDVEVTRKRVNCEEFAKEGFAAQLKSVVMLKNHNAALPLRGRVKVYLPTQGEGSSDLVAAVKRYFEVVKEPSQAECALVFVASPNGGKGYSRDDVARGGNGYLPISLQYGEYRAKYARKQSLSGGDPMEEFTNRTYRNKTVTAKNANDAELVAEVRKKMGEKPVIVCVAAKNPMVFSEIEPYADAILLGFGVQPQAFTAIVSGGAEPQGLLPMQMPKDMRTVEEQSEDLPFDMKCYKDGDGNSYDFAFGLNWSGVIRDWRTERYKNK
jgi:beta-glucosidase